MLVNTVSRTLPYKSVVYDAVTRDGPPGPRNYPVQGIASRIAEKIQGLPYADLMRFLRDRAPDFDYSRSVKNSLPAASFGEAGSERILEYVEQLTFGYRRNDLNGYREYKSNHLAVQRAVRDREENRVFTESDIATDDSDDVRRETLEIKQKIPYLLKQLHIKSKEIGISLISVVIANEKVRAKYPDKSSKPVKLVEEGIYYMDKTGHITGRMANVIGSFPLQLHLWVSGAENHYDIYYASAVELLGYCERIGVDLTLEDAGKYQEEFIRSLPFDYVIRNEDLPLAIASQRSRLSREALFRIRSTSLDELAAPGSAQAGLAICSAVKDGPAGQSLVSKAMGMYRSRLELRRYMLTDTEQYKALIQLSIAFDSIKMGHIIEKGMYRNDGFYMDRGGRMIMKNIAYLGAGGGGISVIFHDSGYAVLTPSSEQNLSPVRCAAFSELTLALREYAGSSKGSARLEWEIL
jgi:hypothetical protein